jgi:hypothetical protein
MAEHQRQSALSHERDVMQRRRRRRDRHHRDARHAAMRELKQRVDLLENVLRLSHTIMFDPVRDIASFSPAWSDKYIPVRNSGSTRPKSCAVVAALLPATAGGATSQTIVPFPRTRRMSR